MTDEDRRHHSQTTDDPMISYLINLDRDAARRTFMERQLEVAGILYERIPAVSGSVLLPSEIALHHGDTVGKKLSANEIGCLLSHASAWDALLASDAPAAFVMEDDIHLAPGLRSVLEALEQLPNVADVLFKLEATPMRVKVSRRPTALSGRHHLHELRSSQMGTAAYVVGRNAAARLLGALKTSAVPADHMMFDPQGPAADIPRYQLIPAPCIQNGFIDSSAKQNFKSSIGERLTVEGARPFATLRKPIAHLVNLVRNRVPLTPVLRLQVPFG